MSRYNRVRSKPVLVEESYTNNIRQTIQPGDDVIVVTTCTGNTKIKRGTYLGKKNDHVSCRVVEPRLVGYSLKETGERYTLTEHYNRVTEHAGPTPRYTSNIGYDKYREEYDAWYVKYRKFFDLHDAVYEDSYRGTTLQLDRIYKIDTSVFDLKL